LFDGVTLVQLEYFRTLVRLGSLTRAAETLNVTQPTLSTSLARLEKQYGVQLVTRIPRKGVEPTLSGQRLLNALEPLLDAADTLAAVARGTSDPLGGKLSIGIYGPLAPFYAAEIRLETSKMLPGVTLRLMEGNLDELPDALRRHQLDMALMYADELTEEFRATEMRTIRPHAVVSEKHPLARSGRSSVSLKELADEPGAFFSAPHSFSRYISFFRSLGITPRVTFTSPNYETVRSYVATGLAYTLLHHEHLTQETHCGRSVVALQIKENVAASSLAAVSPTSAQPSAITEKMLEVLRSVVDNYAQAVEAQRPTV